MIPYIPLDGQSHGSLVDLGRKASPHCLWLEPNGGFGYVTIVSVCYYAAFVAAAASAAADAAAGWR